MRLIDFPGGLFAFEGDIGFKSEYYTNDPEKMEVFCAESGEVFWGGTSNWTVRAELMVQPVVLQRE